jgi:hypothetical protein
MRFGLSSHLKLIFPLEKQSTKSKSRSVGKPEVRRITRFPRYMTDVRQGPVIYAQSRRVNSSFMQLTAKSFLENDNLRDEYEMLYADIPKSIPFARIALGKEPDAINFWLGKFIAYSIDMLAHPDYDREFKDCDCSAQGSLREYIYPG